MQQKEPTQSVVRYLAAHCVTGCIAGLTWGLLVLATDTAGIRELLSASSYPIANLVLFLLGSVVAFLPIVLAAAIGSLAE